MKKNATSSALKRYFPYLAPNKWQIAFALVLGIITGTSAVLMTFLIGRTIDSMIMKQDGRQLLSMLGLIGGLMILLSLSQWFLQRLANRISYFSIATLRKKTFHHLNQLPIAFYDQTSHGSIMSRFTNDLDIISEATSAILVTSFSGLVTVIISFITMLWLSPILTLVVLFGTFFIFLTNWIVAKTTQHYFRSQQQTLGKITSHLSETIHQQKIVKAYQYEDQSQQAFDQMNQELYIVGRKAQLASSLTNPLSRFVDHLLYIALGAVGAWLIFQNIGHISIGIISSFIIYAGQFSKPFIDLSGIMTQIQTALAGLDRIFYLQDQPLEKDLGTQQLDCKQIKGNITFDHVAFAYQADKPLITDFHLAVEAGQTIAIVGQTGAGKSTLINLLMRFYDLDHGRILLDGIDITQYTRDSLRLAFGMVLQETWLFHGTVWDNLTIGRPHATFEEVREACRRASIDTFINRLPEGYQTLIGDEGMSISEGQRQLLTIARIMLCDQPMLILDEATSSIDTLTELDTQKAFKHMMRGRTSFVIAHRLSTIRDADQIIVMSQGQIVEIGHHDQLLADHNSHYYKLYQAQFQPIENN